VPVAPLLRTSCRGKDGGANSACRSADGKSPLRDHSMGRSHVSDREVERELCQTAGPDAGCERTQEVVRAGVPARDVCWLASGLGVQHRHQRSYAAIQLGRAAVIGDSEPSTAE
jgi:hypothetical protein